MSKSVARKAALDIGFNSYAAYLRSNLWKNRRKDFYSKYKGECLICGCDHDLNLHHITYERLGNEIDEDLVPLCEHHHNLIHDVLNKVDDIDPFWILQLMKQHHDAWKNYDQQFFDLVNQSIFLNEPQESIAKDLDTDDLGFVSSIDFLGYDDTSMMTNADVGPIQEGQSTLSISLTKLVNL